VWFSESSGQIFDLFLGLFFLFVGVMAGDSNSASVPNGAGNASNVKHEKTERIERFEDDSNSETFTQTTERKEERKKAVKPQVGG
jgi:hypothetical protein